jgi:hypothetical protein
MHKPPTYRKLDKEPQVSICLTTLPLNTAYVTIELRISLSLSLSLSENTQIIPPEKNKQTNKGQHEQYE